jgi:hypothetical protein
VCASLVGFDRIARCHREVVGKFVGGEPAHFACLVRLAVSRRALQDASQVRRGDPVLAFVREQVIGDAQQAVDGNFQAHLFEGLANCAGLEGFEELYLAADDAPTPRFRGKFSQRQQNPAAFVNEQDTGPYSWGGELAFTEVAAAIIALDSTPTWIPWEAGC